MQDFFQELGATMAEHVMLVVAQEGDENSPLVAGALNLVGQASNRSKMTRSCHSLHFGKYEIGCLIPVANMR